MAVAPDADEETYAAAQRVVRDGVRLAAVRATGLLDSEVEEVFDRLTRLAVRLLHIPAAFISLVDENRDFYKSACGFGEPLASARELSGPTFCHYAIQSTEPLVIPDTRADPVYRSVPTVKSLGVAAYVGVPLVIGGQVVGSFCAIDLAPRAWTAEDLEVLVELAASAQREMELRGALRAAEAANRAKADFLASMSHELRTPLNAIGGYAELMLLGIHGAPNTGQREALERIRRSQKHLLGLISSILDFARVEAGRIDYDIDTVVVADVVNEVRILVEALVTSKQQTLAIHPPAGNDASGSDVVAVRADRDKLVQVMLNLLSNAVKFTDEGGRITVRWSVEEEQVCIAVEDTGRGIPEDKLTAIFEPFVQVDSGHTRVAEGTGLGLAISRDLARGMDGDLSARSRMGVGSTFELVLPRA